MRGWLHTYAFFVAVVCGIVLCSIAATRPGLGAAASAALIYSLTVCGLFGTSALYHRRVWSRARLPDHAPAGPLDDLRVHRRHVHAVLRAAAAAPRQATVMLVAGLGRRARSASALKMIWPHAPRWVSAPLYLALGWVAVAILPDILHQRRRHRAGAADRRRRRSTRVGAVFYALRRPNPWPTVFGHHEFFHACTLVAAICHHIAIYFALFA